MKFGVPWSVKGIRAEARETARQAARRSGMSLEDWLNTVIMQQAAQSGLAGQPHGSQDEASYRAEIAGVNQRLDDLTGRLERFTHTGPAAYAPRRREPAAELSAPSAQPVEPPLPATQTAPPLAPAMPNLPMPPALERALAEIAARQRTLNSEPLPARPEQVGEPARPPISHEPMQAREPVPPREAPPMGPPSPEMPTQDLSGLEQQLRNITDQIETLRKPGVEEAINALREELGYIGSALDDAMPKRALDAIERQIAGLSQRIAEGRQAGVDAGALAGIEHGLMEVRDALHHLMPAEHLVGFTEAVSDLAQKIDLIVAQRDPATLRQLDDAITTLRGMASNVASNEAVGQLAAQVQALSDKIEHVDSGAVGNVLSGLEHRIDALSRALAERPQAGNTVPPRLEALVQSLADKLDHLGGGAVGDVLGSLEHRIDALSQAVTEHAEAGNTVPPRLEALVQSLADKIEQIQHAHGGDSVAVSHLEDRIVALVERLDASDSRLGHLEAIERGLADLLVHLEEMRWAKQQPVESPYVDVLKNDMARTQDSLEAVHSTLGLVVERLATIEEGIRNERPVPAPAAPAVPRAAEEPFELPPPAGKLGRLIGETPKPASPERSQLLDALMPAHAPEVHMPEPETPATTPEVRAPELAPPEPEVHLPAHAAEEPELHLPAHASELRMPAHAPEPPPLVHTPEPPMPAAKPQPTPQRPPSAAQAPLNPDLPPDQPLEPGSGPPQFRAHSSTRLAALEAALGGARPAQSASGQSDFIAAARRAAKAALQEDEVKALRGVELEEPGGGLSTLRDKMMKRVKSLLVAAAIVALVVGSAEIAGNYLHDGGGATKTAQLAGTKSTKAPKAPKLATAAPDPAISLLSPAKIDAMPPSVAGAPKPREPDLFNPPVMYPPGDITGSIPKAASNPHPAPPPKVAPVEETDGLPSGIGSTRLRKAALAGEAGAAYEVATRYAEGHGVTADVQQAAHWYELAASKGLAAAQFRFASMLEKGQGVTKDLARASKLYRAAANQGNAKAMHNLAVLYAEGIDGKPDYANAVTWFRKAAQHGVSDSQYNLGVLYARGIGTEKNLEESYKWFALAAAQGDKESGKKRDEIASHLDAKELAAARHAVESFKALPQPDAAIAVPAPADGWGKPSVPVKSQAQPAGPLSLGSFTVGNR